MLTKEFEKLNAVLDLEEKDIFDLKVMKKGLITFMNEAYTIPNVGNLARCKMKGLFGLMKMDSIILTPLDKEMPILNIDIVKAMGKVTIVIELHALHNEAKVYEDVFMPIKTKYKVVDTEKNTDETNYASAIHQKGGITFKLAKEISFVYLTTYLELLEKAPLADRKAKERSTKDYVDYLLASDGVSTKMMKDMFGDNTVEELYYTCMFGLK